MRKKLLLLTVLVVGAATLGAGIVFASGGAWSRGGGVKVATTESGGGSSIGCGTAYQTTDGQAQFFPDNIVDVDGDWDALTPASSVTLTKKCHGGAVATFSSETAATVEEPPAVTPQDVDNSDIVVIVRATCIHPLPKIASPCHIGDKVYASPGGFDNPVFFDLAPDIHEVHSMTFAFGELAPGTWTVDVLPATNTDEPNGFLDYRTLFVQTL